MEQREELSSDTFIQRLKLASGEGDEVVMRGFALETRGVTLNIGMKALQGVRKLTFADCLLPHVRITSDRAYEFALEDVACPHVFVDKACRNFETRNATIGELTSLAKEVALGGRFSTVKLVGTDRFSWIGATVRTLVIQAASARMCFPSEDDAGDGLPLVVTRLIATDNPHLARALRLICPETPIAFTGSTDAL